MTFYLDYGIILLKVLKPQASPLINSGARV